MPVAGEQPVIFIGIYLMKAKPIVVLAAGLCRVNRFCGTYIRASSTIRTHFRIDGVLIAFRNCPYRTFIDTTAASNAIVTNYVSHFFRFFN